MARKSSRRHSRRRDPSDSERPGVSMLGRLKEGMPDNQRLGSLLFTFLKAHIRRCMSEDEKDRSGNSALLDALKLWLLLKGEEWIQLREERVEQVLLRFEPYHIQKLQAQLDLCTTIGQPELVLKSESDFSRTVPSVSGADQSRGPIKPRQGLSGSQRSEDQDSRPWKKDHLMERERRKRKRKTGACSQNKDDGQATHYSSVNSRYNESTQPNQDAVTNVGGERSRAYKGVRYPTRRHANVNASDGDTQNSGMDDPNSEADSRTTANNGAHGVSRTPDRVRRCRSPERNWSRGERGRVSPLRPRSRPEMVRGRGRSRAPSRSSSQSSAAPRAVGTRSSSMSGRSRRTSVSIEFKFKRRSRAPRRARWNDDTIHSCKRASSSSRCQSRAPRRRRGHNSVDPFQRQAEYPVQYQRGRCTANRNPHLDSAAAFRNAARRGGFSGWWREFGRQRRAKEAFRQPVYLPTSSYQFPQPYAIPDNRFMWRDRKRPSSLPPPMMGNDASTHNSGGDFHELEPMPIPLSNTQYLERASANSPYMCGALPVARSSSRISRLSDIQRPGFGTWNGDVSKKRPTTEATSTAAASVTFSGSRSDASEAETDMYDTRTLYSESESNVEIERGESYGGDDQRRQAAIL